MGRESWTPGLLWTPCLTPGWHTLSLWACFPHLLQKGGLDC